MEIRSWCLSDERLRELLEVQAYFGLPSPALVEKDLYVVKALAAIAAITEGLLTAGFKFDAKDPAYSKSGNESRYTIYRLPYEPAATGEGALRPTIQIETAVWPLRRMAVERPVISFVAEALRRPPEIASIACVSILETAADKFVGLTRRAGAELAGLDGQDA